MGSAAIWVLVVDDDDELRESVVDILIDSGYHAKGVSGGAAALEVLRTERPSLVLADLSMKGMDGKEFLMRARKQERPMPPFVFITGAGSSELEDISGTVLHKPFDSAQLLGVVAHHCA